MPNLSSDWERWTGDSCSGAQESSSCVGSKAEALETSERMPLRWKVFLLRLALRKSEERVADGNDLAVLWLLDCLLSLEWYCISSGGKSSSSSQLSLSTSEEPILVFEGARQLGLRISFCWPAPVCSSLTCWTDAVLTQLELENAKTDESQLPLLPVSLGRGDAVRPSPVLKNGKSSLVGAGRGVA